MKKIIRYDGYLTEQKLGDILTDMFGEDNVTKQFKFSDVDDYKLFRYDFMYTYNNINYLVEFDGRAHFNSADTIRRDEIKEQIFQNTTLDNYYQKVIRIPYFVQLTNKVASKLIPHFDEMNIEIEQNYSHGFIDKKAMLPADWTALGEVRFLKVLSDRSHPLHDAYIMVMFQIYHFGSEYGNDDPKFKIGCGKIYDELQEFSGDSGMFYDVTEQ